VLGGDVVEAVTALKAEVAGEIQVAGSIQLAQWLIANDLVDEIHLMTFPIVLGTGRRLFGETTDASRWKLTGSRTVGEGILITIFQRDQK
jgi:dihydrofolate reductase